MAEQRALPCVVMRGGTSRALFFREEHLPGPQAERDRWLRRAIGAHDPHQVDGLGGARVPTSKVAVISPPSDSQADLEYLAGMVGIGQDTIHYDNNCGNILAAVAHYAVEEGFVKGLAPLTRVRILNRNSGDLIVAEVQVNEAGQPRVQGDLLMAGTPEPGAPLFLDFSLAARAGRAVLDQPVSSLGSYLVTLGGVGARTAQVSAEQMGIRGDEPSDSLQHNSDFMARVEEVHRLAGGVLGRCTPATPFVVVLAPGPEGGELHVRSVGLSRVHPTLAATVAVSVAAAARVPGTVPSQLLRSCPDPIRLKLGSGGVFEVFAGERLGYARTARRIMQGTLFLPL